MSSSTRAAPSPADVVRQVRPGPTLAAIVLLAAPAVLGSACQDPCVTLAERICNCAETPPERAECRQERVIGQRSVLVIDEADRDLCEAKLDTCNCTAIDQNNLDACGFVPVSDAGTEGGE